MSVHARPRSVRLAVGAALLALLTLACTDATMRTSERTAGGPSAGTVVEVPVEVPPLHAAIDGLRAAAVTFGVAGGAAAELQVRVAERPADRAQGLKGVTRLPEGTGMLFLFPEAAADAPRGGFWMLDTRIALDIAFVADGEVVGVATMRPCAAQPCPITHPGRDYDAAVETGAGWFAARGVVVGTPVTWTASVPAG